jgi:hypothetical protein
MIMFWACAAFIGNSSRPVRWFLTWERTSENIREPFSISAREWSPWATNFRSFAGFRRIPAGFSFEFHSESAEQAIACILRFSDAKFSYFTGEEPQSLGEPVSTEAMIKIIFVTHR